MSTFKEQPERNIGPTSSESSTNQDSVQEPFVLVTREKRGRQRKQVSSIVVPQSPDTYDSQGTIRGGSEADAPSGQTLYKPGRKIKKNSQRAKMLGLGTANQEQRTVEWGLSLMDDRVMTLKQSKFYHAFQELVQMTFSPCCKNDDHTTKANTMEGESQPQKTLAGDTFMPGAADAASGSCGKSILDSDQEPKGPHDSALITSAARNEIRDMVFYGIGSVESSRNSQFQLALGICLKEILQIPGTMSIFDPVMTGFDMQLSERLGFNVLKPNDQAKQVLNSRTLLYMPHCPKGLYSHVLESNWSREHLDNLVILGNRFTMYDESLSFRQNVKQAPFILPALSIAHITPLPDVKFEDDTIFNDLAFHGFPTDKAVPEVDIRDREIDPELL